MGSWGRTWVSGSHGLPRSWDHGAERGLVAVMVFLDHGITGQNMGEVAASWGQSVGA